MNIGASRQLSGEYGGTYYNDTAAHTGNWQGLKAIGGSAVFTALTSNISGLSSFTLTQGDVLPGVITGFTLSSGAVVAYNRKY